MGPEFHFNLHLGDEVEECSPDMLRQVAQSLRLDEFIPGRYAAKFVFKLHAFHRAYGVNPFQVLAEVRALEDSTHPSRTKPATEFIHPPLKGLWHKHFFTGRFIAQNLLIHHGKNGIGKIASEELPMGEICTPDMLNRLTQRLVNDALEQRTDAGKLTGEWIVFAKHEGQNYYLSLETHLTGDDEVYRRLETMCFPQFPFLLSTQNNGN